MNLEPIDVLWVRTPLPDIAPGDALTLLDRPKKLEAVDELDGERDDSNRPGVTGEGGGPVDGESTRDWSGALADELDFFSAPDVNHVEGGLESVITAGLSTTFPPRIAFGTSALFWLSLTCGGTSDREVNAFHSVVSVTSTLPVRRLTTLRLGEVRTEAGNDRDPY